MFRLTPPGNFRMAPLDRHRGGGHPVKISDGRPYRDSEATADSARQVNPRVVAYC